MRSKFRMLTIMVTTIVMIFVFAGCGNSAKSVIAVWDRRGGVCCPAFFAISQRNF